MTTPEPPPPDQEHLTDPETLSFEEEPPRPIPPVRLEYASRELTMHFVTEEELTTLRAVVPTTTVGFLGISIGAALTFWTVLAEGGLTGTAEDTFNLGLKFALVLSAFFAIVAVVGYAHLFIVIRRIKRRPGPGERGGHAKP